MPNLYALFVAIDHYPNPAHRLGGCLNDLREMKEFIRYYCKAQHIQLHEQTLKDREATRNGIIEGFEHLGKAKDGDHCLFFFAGHGSRCKAPQEFWHLCPDKMNESIVCYDSRLEEGRDLVDKELSYLIWKTTHDKNVQFVSITDCCHSGSNMRLEPTKERRMAKDEQTISAQEYLGFEHYSEDRPGQFTPPKGRYIHLAASLPHETAKEIKSKGQARGFFSFLLLKTLKNSRSLLTYQELMSRTRARVGFYLSDQYPVLEATYSQDKDSLFLRDVEIEKDNEQPYLVSYHRQKGWIINIGAMNGLDPTRASRQYEFNLLESNTVLNLKKIYADHSLVEGMLGFEKKTVYRAQLKASSIAKIGIAIDPTSESEGVNWLKAQLTERPSSYISLIDSMDIASYRIHARQGQYWLTTPHDDRPLFRKINSDNASSAGSFIARVEQVAKWRQVQELNHPGSSMRLESVQLSLFKGLENGNLAPDAPVELVDHHAHPVFEQNEEGLPTFKLNVKNTNSFPIYVSVLYLSVDFGISNVLMDIERLSPGDTAWCAYKPKDQDQPNPVIPIEMHEVLHQWGFTRATNYLKVIASTAPIDTDQFNQNGLSLEDYFDQERNLAIRTRPPQEDWLAMTIPLTVHQSHPSHRLADAQPALAYGHSFQGPQKFRALMSFKTWKEACDELGFCPDIPNEEDRFLPWQDLGPAESRPGLCVAKLTDCTGWQDINDTDPLKIQLIRNMPIRAYGLDEQHTHLMQLPFSLDQEAIEIYRLPAPTEAHPNAIYLFFFC